MRFSIAVILAVTAAPAHSFSYLESLSGPVTTVSNVDIAPPVPAAATETDAPFFFTNGAQDEPADSPAFFFTSGSTDVPAAAAATTTKTSSGSYLDNLGGVNTIPAAAPPPSDLQTVSAASSASYLDHIGNGVTSVSGPGMANYLDALPQNSVSAGPGLSSYASSLNHAASVTMAPEIVAAVHATPLVADSVIAPNFDEVTMSTASNPSSYLEALATGASTNGAGIATYLDTLPQTSTLSGGSGISTYASNLVSSNVINGGGVPSYTDSIGGGISSFTNSFSPFLSAASTGSESNFAIGSVNGRFDLTLEADEEIIAQLQAAGNKKVTIRGKMMLN